MPRLKTRRPRRLTADEQRRMLAAFLVGKRIMAGITDEQLATRMGVLHREPPLPKRPRKIKILQRELRIAEIVRTMELKMADPRLSTLQRYSHSMGLQIDVRLRRRGVSVVRRTRAIRHRRKVVAQRFGKPRRMFVL